jgi:hypothetical protein
MNRYTLWVVMLCFTFSAAAQSVDPVAYAKEVKAILDARAKQVVKKIKDQNSRYDTLADILLQAQTDQLKAQMATGAQQASRELEIDYISGHRNPLNWRRDLQPHIREMQEALLRSLLSDLDQDQRYLSAFEGLQADLDKTEKIAKLVGLLTVKRNLKEELLRWYEYGNGTKDKFNELACSETKAALTKKQDAAKKAEADLPGITDPAARLAKQQEITKLKEDVKSLEAWVKAKSCK